MPAMTPPEPWWYNALVPIGVFLAAIVTALVATASRREETRHRQADGKAAAMKTYITRLSLEQHYQRLMDQEDEYIKKSMDRTKEGDLDSTVSRGPREDRAKHQAQRDEYKNLLEANDAKFNAAKLMTRAWLDPATIDWFYEQTPLVFEEAVEPAEVIEDFMDLTAQEIAATRKSRFALWRYRRRVFAQLRQPPRRYIMQRKLIRSFLSPVMKLDHELWMDRDKKANDAD